MTSHAYSIGQRVRAVRGPKSTMNPEPRYVGRVGTIALTMPPIAGEPYYKVSFGGSAIDFIDQCNLEILP